MSAGRQASPKNVNPQKKDPIRTVKLRTQPSVTTKPRRPTILQVQTILVTQSEEGASRLRDAQISFITRRRERSSSTSASHESLPDSQRSALQQSGGQSCITERITPSDGHSYAQTAIRGSLWRDDES